MGGDTAPRLTLPDDLPGPDRARVLQILALSGREVGPGGVPAVWNRPAPHPGTIELTPLRLGSPDRIAGLRLRPFGPPRGPADDSAVLDAARAALQALRHWDLATAPLPPARPHPAPEPEPGHALILATQEDRRQDLRELLFLAAEEFPRAPRLVLGDSALTPADLEGAARVAPGVPLRDLLDGAVAVLAVTAPLGFDAILAGHRPVALGAPDWAGHGLSDDRGPVTRAQRPLTRAQLLARVLIEDAIWLDPHRGTITDLAGAIRAEAALARAAREDAAGYVAAGMALWKRRHVAAALGGRVRFAAPARAPAIARRLGRPLLIWGSAAVAPPEMPGTPTIRVEDGLLRSRGLGARLTPPLALALDDLGLASDPAWESRLERLIAAAPRLPPSEIARAERLIARLVGLGLTKYNIGMPPQRDLPPGAILVAGQVEDDAAVRLGAGAVRTNLALLEAVRQANPGAPILYKPHPDVEAGLRPGRVPEAAARGLADRIVTGADPATLLPRVACVWTIASGLGFEALLRGVPVTCLGAPFYAGWGLTHDLGPVPGRRQARPGRAGLVHAALIGYPRYTDPVSGLPCPVEVAVDRLAEGRTPGPGGLLAKLQGLRATLARR